MVHKGTVRIETERLILRRFVIDDAEAMYRNWAGEEEVVKFLTWPLHEDVEISKAVVQSWIVQYENPHFYNWGIELKEIGEVIGNISVVRLNEDTMSCDIGYCIGTKWWGQGIMPEAGAAVIRFLFNDVGVNRIAAAHDYNNPKSGRVMQKIGMKYEGTMRQAGLNNQGIIDEVWYSVLASEYLGKDTLEVDGDLG